MIATSIALAIASVVVSAAGAGYGAMQASNQAKQAEKMGTYNAAVQKNNALAAAQQAQFDAQRIRDKNRRNLASAQADILKNGATTGGTGDDILYDQGIQGEMDAMAREYTGHIQSDSANQGATLATAEGQNRAASYRSSEYGSLLSGAGSTLSGAANVYNMDYQQRNPQFRN